MRLAAGIVLAAALAVAAPARAAGPVYTLAGDGLGRGRLATDRRFAEVSLVALDRRGDLAFSDAGRDHIRVVSRRGALATLRLSGPGALALTARGVPLVANDQGIFAFPHGRRTPFAGAPGQVPLSPQAIGDGLPARAAELALPDGLARGPDGSVYVADSGNHRVRRIAPGGRIETVAGTGAEESSGDGGPARAAGIGSPDAVALAADGSVLVVDAQRLRRITPQGAIEAVPGLLVPVSGVIAAPDGGAYVIDGDGDVLRLAPDGAVTKVAGTGTPGFSGDGGPATQAQIGASALALAPGGGLLVADEGANRVRRIRPDGVIETIAGTGVAGEAGDGGPALQAQLGDLRSIAVGPDGGILVLESGHDPRVRPIAPDGTIATLGGGPLAATDAPGAELDAVAALVALPDGGFLVTDSNDRRVYRAPPGGGPLTTLAGGGEPNGDGGPALGAAVRAAGLAVAPDGGVLVADADGQRVRRIARGGTISTVARAGPYPVAVAPAAGGTVLVATGRRVRRVGAHGARTVAGDGRSGEPRDGASATRTPLQATSLAALPHGAFAAVTVGGALVRVAHGRVHTLVAAQIGVFVRAVAADADGGIAYADRGTVRYLPPRRPHRLAVMVRGRRAVASHAARVAVDWYRGAHRVARPRAPGLYRVHARAWRGAARASSWSAVVLGGRLPARLLDEALQASPEATVSAADELPFRQLTGCRRHGPRRIDCEIDVGDAYPVIDCAARGRVVLGRDHLVRARETECGPVPALKRRPRWLGPLVVADLLA